MSINDRIQEIIDSLYSGNKRAFSLAIGVSPSVIENIVGKRKSNPSFDVTNKIINSIEDINIEWLMTGNGKMTNRTPYPTTESASILAEEDVAYGKTSPSFSTRPFISSVSDTFSNAIELKNYNNISIPFIGEYDFCLRVYGDGMQNSENVKKSINDRDIIICRFWKNRSYIRWGEVYALSTTDGYIIKKIMPSEKDGFIKCISFNQKAGYESYDLPLHEIFDWAIVVGTMRITVW